MVDFVVLEPDVDKQLLLIVVGTRIEKPPPKAPENPSIFPVKKVVALRDQGVTGLAHALKGQDHHLLQMLEARLIIFWARSISLARKSPILACQSMSSD